MKVSRSRVVRTTEMTSATHQHAESWPLCLLVWNWWGRLNPPILGPAGPNITEITEGESSDYSGLHSD